MAIGRHLMADFYLCEAAFLDDPASLERELAGAARRAGAEVQGTLFHRFTPCGVSGVVVISSSHLAVHTYPEHDYAALDFFISGRMVDPGIICELLAASFRPRVIATCSFIRGQHLGEDRPSRSV